MVPTGVGEGVDPRGFREAVLRSVHRCTGGGALLHDAIAQEFAKSGLNPRLRGSVTSQASDVIRRQITIDHLISVFSKTPLGKLDRMLLDILRVAIAEILFCERIPARASVNEAVNLAKKLTRGRLGGFANALLRNIVRTIDGAHPIGGEFTPAADRLRIDSDTELHFTRDVFPDPGADSVGYMSVTGGMPRWLVERWRRNFGDVETDRIIAASNSTPPVSLRVNRLKTTTEKLLAELSAASADVLPGEADDQIRVRSHVELSALDAFARGEFYIQDFSAMRAPRMLAPRKGEKILDLCAAPGGKTTHLAELALDGADILAVDVSKARIRLIEENAKRLGVTCIRTTVADARELTDDMTGAFDAVLADVPCSNTGVLSRRVEVRHRLSVEAIGRIAQLQREILTVGIAACRPGGRVVYSTCSIEPEETGEQVLRVVDEHSDWRLECEELILPREDGHDGAYVALLMSRG